MMVVMGTPLGGEAMIKEMTVSHLAAIAARKVTFKEKKKAIFSIHPPYVPPKRGEYMTAYGRMKIRVWLDKTKGQWMVEVRFDEELPNPVLPPEKARELLKK